jgi:hypothetical protein
LGKSNKADKEATAQSDVNTIVTTVLEKTRSFDPELAKLWETTAKQRDEMSRALAAAHAPPDFMAQAKAWKEVFPQLFGPVAAPPLPPPPQPDTLAIVKEVLAVQPNPMLMWKEMKEALTSAKPAVDGLSQFREIFSFALDLIDTRDGRGGGGRRSGWDIGLDIVKEGGQQVLQPVLNFVQSMMVLRNQGAGATPPVPSMAPTPPSAFDPYRNPQATRAYANTLNTQQSQQQQPPAGQQPASPPPPPSPAPPPPPPEGVNQELFALFTQYGGLIVNALNNSTPGFEVADYVSGLLGTATHAAIVRHGEAAILQTMSAFPDIAMFGEPRLQQFVHEFDRGTKGYARRFARRAAGGNLTGNPLPRLPSQCNRLRSDTAASQWPLQSLQGIPGWADPPNRSVEGTMAWTVNPTAAHLRALVDTIIPRRSRVLGGDRLFF